VNAAHLEPVFGADSHPGVSDRQAEQNELFRIRASALMADPQWVRKADRETLACAKHWSAIKPLGRALSNGEPT
jgi:hypothetical protein